jgi:hypothetical protein
MAIIEVRKIAVHYLSILYYILKSWSQIILFSLSKSKLVLQINFLLVKVYVLLILIHMFHELFFFHLFLHDKILILAILSIMLVIIYLEFAIKLVFLLRLPSTVIHIFLHQIQFLHLLYYFVYRLLHK